MRARIGSGSDASTLPVPVALAQRRHVRNAGEVAERLNAPVLKTGKGLAPFEGSNPSLSATNKQAVTS